MGRTDVRIGDVGDRDHVGSVGGDDIHRRAPMERRMAWDDIDS